MRPHGDRHDATRAERERSALKRASKTMQDRYKCTHEGCTTAAESVIVEKNDETETEPAEPCLACGKHATQMLASPSVDFREEPLPTRVTGNPGGEASVNRARMFRRQSLVLVNEEHHPRAFLQYVPAKGVTDREFDAFTEASA